MRNNIMTRNYQAETAASITALARRIMDTNLCKEIVLNLDVFYAPITPLRNIKVPPKLKYQFSRANSYIASYGHHDVIEVFDWCEQQFGTCPTTRDAWCRWHSDRPWVSIYFRDQKDYNWFVLRWGG